MLDPGCAGRCRDRGRLIRSSAELRPVTFLTLRTMDLSTFTRLYLRCFFFFYELMNICCKGESRQPRVVSNWVHCMNRLIQLGVWYERGLPVWPMHMRATS